MAGEPAVQVDDLWKWFGRDRPGRARVTALEGVSLTIERGECVAILGQNGSGKSTLVRVLSTLLSYERGEVRIFGHDVRRDERIVQRLINRVSVEACFYKKLSPLENLSYAARFYGLGPSLTRARIPEILGGIGFPPDRLRTPMETLSRGQQQKVALARAILTKPALMLLDEPTTGLDVRARREVQAVIRAMGADGMTTLLCTHDMQEAEFLSGRVGILHGGRLLALEPSASLQARFGADSLEEAFLAATGKAFADDETEGDH